MSIPIHFENDENAYLHVDKEGLFTIKAHLYAVNDPKQWVDDSGYSVCFRTGITFDELVTFLPVISDYLKVTIEIEAKTETLPKRHRSVVDSEELSCTFYTVHVNNKTIFNKNTYKDGSIKELKGQIIARIGLLIYDFEIYKQFWMR